MPTKISYESLLDHFDKNDGGMYTDCFIHAYLNGVEELEVSHINHASYHGMRNGEKYVGRDVPKYSASIDEAIKFIDTYLPKMRIINICDDTISVGVKLWIYPNGLAEPGEFITRGMSYTTAGALLIAAIKAYERIKLKH